MRTTHKEGGLRLRQGARSTPPLVSIISVVFRASRELPRLIESVAAQKGDDSEFIIIDGGSDDGTLDILRQFDDVIDYWVSEPDRGIYDAMNKGIAAATGEFVLHLNAGDALIFIPREELREFLAKDIDVACFKVLMAGWGEYRPKTGFLRNLQYIDNIWHHQGQFYRRGRHPGYDLRYRTYADFDCNQRMFKARKSLETSQTLVAEQYEVGVSGSGSYWEVFRIVRSNFGIGCAMLAMVWRSLAGLRYRLKHLLTWWESQKNKSTAGS